jgi:hypothetical protein
MAEREAIHFSLWVQLTPRPIVPASALPELACETPPVTGPASCAFPHQCVQTSCSLFGAMSLKECVASVGD